MQHVATNVLCCVQTAGGSGGISTVQVKGGNAGWIGLKNKYGGMWELDTQPELPLDVRVVADSGQEVGHSCLWYHTVLHLQGSGLCFCMRHIREVLQTLQRMPSPCVGRVF